MIPWGKMNAKTSNALAFLKGLLIVFISCAFGVVALIQSNDNRNTNNSQGDKIESLIVSNALLIKNENDLKLQLTQARLELSVIQRELQMKDSRIAELEVREKSLLARIEELELKIKKS